MPTANQLRKIIAASLAAGLTPKEIAERENIDASYVSQLKEDATFKILLAQHEGNYTEAEEKRNSLLDRIQDKTLETIDQNMDKFLKTTNDAIRVFKMANEAKRSGRYGSQQTTNVTVVNLPAFITGKMKTIEHKTNENNEVIEVGGRALVSQTSAKLLEEVEERKHAQVTAAAEHSADELPEEFAALVLETSDPVKELLDEVSDDPEEF